MVSNGSLDNNMLMAGISLFTFNLKMNWSLHWIHNISVYYLCGHIKMHYLSLHRNCICGVVLESVVAASDVDHVFESGLGQTKDYIYVASTIRSKSTLGLNR